MALVVMMHDCSPGEKLTRAAFMDHVGPLAEYQPHMVGMMFEYSTSKLLVRATFMHHYD